MVKASEIDLERTCTACPEQYDAYFKGALVGYLRLRGGHFRVEVPDVRGKRVYDAYPEGDGIFEDHEREFHLKKAREAIAKSLSRKP